MKILLQTGDELLFLAGDGRLGERVFPSATGFELAGELERQIVRQVRGSHARAISRGNVRHRAFFRTRRVFPTPQEAEDYAVNAERSFPRTGTVYFVTGGGTRKLLNARVAPPATGINGCEARLQYQVEGGEFTPLEPELVIDELEQIFYRVVNDANEKWFEVGFDSPELLDGSAADGWTDPFGQFLLRFERSETLTAWDHEWIDCPTSPENVTGGYRYWARSRFPVDSQIKSGVVQCVSGGYFTGQLGGFTSDARNNPLTALTVAGVSLALGGFPYTMPADAARMQTDLRVFYPDATVTASSNLLWEIVIPGVSLASYSQTSKVSWPGYLVPDMFGNLTLTINGVFLTGQFVNAAGVRTLVQKQFARLGVSPGPNYLY